ncbi:MAG TPA: ribosomal protein S18-alanine N-acetyltransferase [Acidobacteriaceae bacterium]|nr:ribosomal protein S18-alanine N-acetyltransferase [Acidobacteriaceae bacterium]
MNRPAPEIRPMLSADLDAVLAIAAASPQAPTWRHSNYSAYLSPPQPHLLRAAFVAVTSGSIVGFAAASLLLDSPETVDPLNRAELDSMAVDPALRHRGIGSALLSAVVAWAEEHGSRHLVLEVRASNLAAVRLYERHGFRHEGRRPYYYADPAEDALLLGKPLLP